MFLFFSSLVLIALLGFFYGIGLWYLAFLPLIFFLLLFSVSSSFHISTSPFSFKILRYPLLFAWVFILIALWGLSFYLWINLFIILLFAWLFNLILWVLSFVLHYEDGKQIFSFWYWFSSILFIFVGLFYCNFDQYFHFLFLLSSLHLWYIAFIFFIVRIWVPQLSEFIYQFILSLFVWLIFFILFVVPNFVLALFLVGVLLFVMYSTLQWFYKQKPVEQEKISVRRILAGERIITKKLFSSLFLAKISEFLHTLPKYVLSSLEFFNIGLVIILLWFFAGHRSSISEFTQILYWLIIALFIANTVLLKKITTTHVVQNLFLFLIVHFAVYVSFFSYFGSAIGPVVFWAIIWNLFTSLFIFYMERFSPGVLIRLDYWYWLIAWSLSFICNVLLLIQAPIPGELIFFLTLLYIGVEWVLLFYAVKYINAIARSD